MIRPVAALAVVLTAACTATPPPATNAVSARRVTVRAAASQDMPRFVEAGGAVHAKTTAAVSSRMVATIRAVAVAAGDRVKAGQTLVLLDSRDVDAARARAAAGAAAAEHGVAAATAERDGADAALTLARLTQGRMSALYDRRSATRQELDEADAALRAAEARARGAATRVLEATSALDGARADATRTTVDASFATVTAPFDGVVTETLVEAGSLATPGTPLLRVEDGSALRLEVYVDERVAANIGRGQEVEVLATTEADEGPLTGRVSEIARAADAGPHAFLVKIALPRPSSLRSGTFARTRIPAGMRRALTVPAAAIVPRGQLSTVFVAVSGRAQMRMLHTGGTSGGLVEVLAGLSPGEHVIVSPPPDLRDGDALVAGVDGAP